MENIITINTKCSLISSNGIPKWFFVHEQYCFNKTVRLLVKCDECNNKDTSSTLKEFYEVPYNEEMYYVPFDKAVHYDQPVKEGIVNKEEYYQIEKGYVGTGEKYDYIKDVKDMYGVDLGNKTRGAEYELKQIPNGVTERTKVRKTKD
jgi:hypothetical protein